MATDNCETGVMGGTSAGAGASEDQLALSQCHRNHVTVSSLSSMDTASYDFNDISVVNVNDAHNKTLVNAHPLPPIPNSSVTSVDDHSLSLSHSFLQSTHTTTPLQHQEQQLQPILPSHLTSSTAPLMGQTTMRLSPTTRVVVPAASAVNTVPEFLCSLTKMLTDNNRDTIEWSNGT
jgi:hypothetical protein